MSSIEQFKNEFLIYLRKDKRRSARTISNYKFYLRRFCIWMEKNKIKSVEDFNQTRFADYREWLKKIYDPARRVYLQVNSQRGHLIALRMFLRFLSAKKGLLFDYRQIKLPLVVRPRAPELSKARIELMLEAPRSAKWSQLLAKRDLAVLELLYSSGLKVSEISNLRKENLDFKKNFIFLKGKYGQREVLISNQARHALSQYLKARRDKSDFVFIGHDRTFFQRARQNEIKGLTPRSVERIVKRYSPAARVGAPVTPEQLRRNYIFSLVKNGETGDAVKKRLGFASDNYKSRFLLRSQ